MNVAILRTLWTHNRARQRVHRPLGDGPGAVCAGCWQLGFVAAYPCVERRHADLTLDLWRRQAPDGVWLHLAPVSPARRIGMRRRGIG